jgi:flagellar biosynthesis GTPase FlhF
MGQKFHKFKAETFDAAYQQMLRTLGKDAVVISTTEIKDGGLRGLLGHTVIELTAAQTGNSGSATARRPSLPEKKYAAYGAAVGSEETVNETVAFFKQLVDQAQPRPKPQAKADPASILPFRRKVEQPPNV